MKNFKIIIESPGAAGAAILKPLEFLSQLRGEKLASLVFRAPSELIRDLPQGKAQELAKILTDAGLEVRVAKNDEKFIAGKKEFEAAMAVKETENMDAIIDQVAALLGIDAKRAQSMVFASPAVLMGEVSENTIKALKKRFEPLGAQIDASRIDEAVYDVFTDNCPASHMAKIKQALFHCGIAALEQGKNDAAKPLLAQGLNRKQAKALWERIGKTALPVKVVNRDFQRFDLVLENAPGNKNMIDYLVASTGMPEKIAPKVVKNAPVVLWQNITFGQMTKHMEAIANAGGSASGNLLAFKAFALEIMEVNDPAAAVLHLENIGGLEKAKALKTARAGKSAGPFAATRCRWLKMELERAGTQTRMVTYDG